MTTPYVTIVLPGAPRGKGRPRFSTVGGFVRTFTDKKTVDYETRLKLAGMAAMEGLQPLNEAISVHVMALLPIPDSWSARKRAQAVEGLIMPIGRPDLDNCVKVLDGLNYQPPAFRGEKRPIIWRDDSQIVAFYGLKMYSEMPRLIVKVFRWFS